MRLCIYLGDYFWVQIYSLSLTLIPAWISKYIHHKVWDEITYPFPNFNGCTVEVWGWISNFITHFIGHMIAYPCWNSIDPFINLGEIDRYLTTTKHNKARTVNIIYGMYFMSMRNLIVTGFHDQMETFPRYWPFVRGIHRLSVNSPHKCQWRGALMFSLIYSWMNGLANTHEAGDLRHHRVHYDVTVMSLLLGQLKLLGNQQIHDWLYTSIHISSIFQSIFMLFKHNQL